MNLSEIFIRRPIMTGLVMAAILFFGIMAFRALPVSDMPNVDYPTIQVSASYPGADPDTMANTIATPLEKQFMTIEGIKTISSTSTAGETSIVLQFNLDKSMGVAAQDVQAAINQATPLLPQNLPFNPTYSKVNPSASPILYLALTSSTLPIATLYDYADNIIGKRLNVVSGVAQVATYGSPYAVRIQIDPQKLAAIGMGIDELATAIQNQNVSIPTGLLYGNATEYAISVDGQINIASGYESLIIRQRDGSIVRLRDVGRALNSLADDKFYLNYLTSELDLPAVILAVQTQPGANSLAVIKEIDKVLPTLTQDLPGALKLRTIFDKSVYIQEAVHDVEFTLIIAIALVVGVIYLYLGRGIDTLIPSLALPLSIIGTFGVMSLLGFSVNILSLLAITLSIGFLVDDAIVVLENIVRHVELGSSPLEAALKGSKEISLTILSMTICLVSVFIPLLFMGGILGRLFHEFSMVIFTAVILSGAISLSLTPMLCSKLIPPHNPNRRKGVIERLSETVHHFLVSIYTRSLHFILFHRKIALLGGFASIVLSITLFKVLPKDFLPGDDIGFIQLFSQASDQTSPFQMIEYQKKMTEIVRKNPYIIESISLGAIPQDNQGIMFIRLKPLGSRPPVSKVIASLYAQLSAVPGIQPFLKPLPLLNLETGTSASYGTYQYTLQSLTSEDLYAHTQRLLQRIQQIPGFSQVTSDLHMSQLLLKVEILRDRASLLGLTAQDIENALNFAYAGANLSPINEPSARYYVILETLPQFYKNPSVLSQIYIRSPKEGKLIPLSAVTKLSEEVSALSVNHVNGLPSVTISFNLSGVPLGPALESLIQATKEILPPSVSGHVQGAADIFQASFGNLTILLIITIFLIYTILGILYENLFHPITVMSTLPPAAIGGLFTLLLFDNPLSLYAYVGLIMLLGIVLKNGIILVDFANESVAQENKSPLDAITHACQVRFRPILMTTISALMGAVPIALGLGGLTAQGRRPLGLVIIGGLLFSQVLTLYLTPVVYLYIEQLRKRSKASDERR